MTIIYFSVFFVMLTLASSSQGKTMDGSKVNSFVETKDLSCCTTRILDIDSRITNPSYPSADSKARSYNYYIKTDSSSCGLRLTYENILLFKYPPTMGSSGCSMDSITILAANYPTQPLCGNLNKNQINVPVQGGQTVQILIVTQSKEHYWNIRLNQINCADVETHPLEKLGDSCGKRPRHVGSLGGPLIFGNHKTNKEDDDVQGKSLDFESHLDICAISSNYKRCYLDSFSPPTKEKPNLLGNRIINGQQARRNSWPWQIVFLVNGKHLLCGGALLSSNLAVTAGHCLAITQKSLDVANITVAAGLHRIGQINVQAEYRHCDRVVIHAQYSDVHSDIALCFFDDPIPFSERISPVCLPYDTDKDFVGHEAVITGFGKTADNSGPASVLHEAPVPIVSNQDCQAAWVEIAGKQFSNLIESSMVCAGGKNKSTCNGDSGGPMTVKLNDKVLGDRYTLVGLTSFGPSSMCNVPNKPLSVFTRVSSHINFIALATAPTSTQDFSNINTYTPCLESLE